MRILLVDDDAGVAQALLAILKTMPEHDVRAASNGGEALAAAAETGGVDLLITDVVMEPMDGFTLRDQITAQYPGVRTILISGYDLSEYPEQTQNHQLLGKPIDAETLRAAVAKELPPAPSEPEPAPAPAPAVVPVAVPVPAAVPKAVPAPAAAPVAVPVARPAGVPVARPSVVAKAVAAPTATPVARPTAVPAQPAAAPSAVPAPAAAPVAVPVARPAGVPVAQPAVFAKAVPAPTATPVARPMAVPAQPAAAPVAVPVAKPTAVPAQPAAIPAAQAQPTVRATAVPVPTAQPAPAAPTVPSAVAVPKVASPAQPTVAAKAVPQPTAAPSPVAKPGPTASAAPGLPTIRVAPTVKSQPISPPNQPGAPSSGMRPVSAVARPAGTPVAAPRQSNIQTKSIPPTAVPSATGAAQSDVPSAPNVGSGEDLSGTMLGAYAILSKLGEGRWGGVYAGVQTSINRPVALEILDSAKAADPVAQTRFVADARAKAAVQHPSILAVYEAGEADGRFFYAYEHVDGKSLAEMKAAGQRLDEASALKVLRVSADGLAYLGSHHTPHTPPDGANIFLGADGHARLGNIATQIADEQLSPQQEIQGLGRVMLGVLPAIQSLSPGLRDLLKRMVQAGPQAFNSWGPVLQAIKASEPKVVPTDAAKISAQDRASIAAVEQARKQQKKSLYYNLASVISLLLLTGVAVWYFAFRNKERVLDEQVHIPAGDFLFANGEKQTLGDFWIDKYEVTFGQYAKFVEYLEGHPTTQYDHEKQPRIKASAFHKPEYWHIYYGQAKVGGKARSIPIDLNCPILDVDFWDAYAYAKWKGRELPTEQEWEKAARGTSGQVYPWGEEFDPKKVNSNADYNGNDPAAKGNVDGFNNWNPVDKIKGDKSPFGVIGMAGNVREWTATWDQAKKRPVAKGGSFMSSDVRLDQRTDLDPSAHSEALGFRTISRTPPTK
jgi:formylglycine-generating enzyme required for sulfatase activity/CheY-like chemotaxis protein